MRFDIRQWIDENWISAMPARVYLFLMTALFGARAAGQRFISMRTRLLQYAPLQPLRPILLLWMPMQTLLQCPRQFAIVRCADGRSKQANPYAATCSARRARRAIERWNGAHSAPFKPFNRLHIPVLFWIRCNGLPTVRRSWTFCF